MYGLRLLEDWRLLTADHGGFVRCWDTRAAAAGAGPRFLAAGPAFAPSVDDPCSALIDLEVRCRLCLRNRSPPAAAAAPDQHHAPSSSVPQGGARPVGQHALDACLTHLAVAGRDSVVRLYSFEEEAAAAGGGEAP